MSSITDRHDGTPHTITTTAVAIRALWLCSNRLRSLTYLSSNPDIPRANYRGWELGYKNNAVKG